MTDFKSNVPKDFRLDIYYQPVKTEYDKQVHAEITRKSWKDPETRAKRAEGVAKAFEDPILKEEQRSRALSALNIVNSNPELKAANGRRGAEIWNDPEIVAKHKESCKNRPKDTLAIKEGHKTKALKNQKKIIADGKEYESVKAWAEKTGCDITTFYNRKKKFPDLYYYIEKNNE
jgi:hypothetical protein